MDDTVVVVASLIQEEANDTEKSTCRCHDCHNERVVILYVILFPDKRREESEGKVMKKGQETGSEILYSTPEYQRRQK